MNRFIKFNPDSELVASMIQAGKHREFVLLSVIGMRARRTPDAVFKLEIGESLLGDWASYGMTRQNYRTALSNLKSWGLVTTRSSRKGTVAKLANTEVYDINAVAESGQGNHKLTTNQPRANHEPTTNKNVKKEKNEKNNYTVDFEKFWQAYPRKEVKSKAAEAFAKISPSQEVLAQIISDVQARARSEDWTKDSGKYIPHPTTYLNQKRWEDETPRLRGIDGGKRQDGPVKDEHGKIKGWWMFGGAEFVENPEYRRSA